MMSPQNKADVERILVDGWGPDPLHNIYKQGIFAAIVGGVVLRWLVRGLQPS